jgi:hypothetical protein
LWIIGDGRANANKDGIAFGAQFMNDAPGCVGRYPLRRTTCRRHGTIQRLGNLGYQRCATLRHRRGKPAIQPLALCFFDTDVNSNAGIAETLDATPGHGGIGIHHADHDRADTRCNDGICTWWRFANMRARFQRYDKHGTRRGVRALLQRHDFGMGLTISSMPTFR